MGLDISNGTYQPDGTILNINPSTGALQIKPGTQGDVLLAGAAGVWARLGIGSNTQVLTSNGTTAVWTGSPGEGWTYLTKMVPSASSSVTSSSLAAYNQYLLICRITSDQAGATGCNLRFNGDTGTNYKSVYINGTAISNATGQTSIQMGNVINTNYYNGAVIINGLSPAVASGICDVAFSTSGVYANGIGISGWWVAGNATQISTITIFPAAGTITGEIEVYGRVQN